MKYRNMLFAAPLAMLLATTQQCQDKLTAIVQAVQAKATVICGFVPTADSVVAVLNAEGVKTGDANDILRGANLVCAAVRPASNKLTFLSNPPVVPVTTKIKGKSVTINGYFVR